MLALLLVCCGCSSKQEVGLLGTWQTGVIPSEWGSNRITETYFPDGRVIGTNDFVGGKPLGWEGTYSVRGAVIQRTIQGATQEIAYRIEGNTMRQKMRDEDYTFTRVITEP